MTIMHTMILAGLLLALTAFLVPALCARLKKSENVFANIAEGTHTDSITMKADAVISTRHLLYKVGSDASHIAVLASINDVPLGTVADEAAAIDDLVAVDLLGSNTTRRMVASEAMATTGVPVFTTAAGKIALSGVMKVGTLLSTAAADGDVVEVQSCVPQVVNRGTAVAATRTILASEMDGRTFFFGHATEFAMTLPAPFLGARGKFICTAAPSSASYTIVTPASATIIKGQITTNDFSGTTDSDFEASGAATITFVDAKAVAGDWVELDSDGTNWFVRGSCSVFDAVTIS